MELRAALLQGFRYDWWANERWLDAAPRMKHAARAEEVLGHIAMAQERWMQRCLGKAAQEPAEVPLRERLAGAAEHWRTYIAQADLEREIVYTTTDGTQYANRLDEIARHVLNHGTYHRGQLRGLAEAEGFEDFPETDLILYLRQ